MSKPRYIPDVDEIADQMLNEPFALIGSKYIELKTREINFDDEDYLRIRINKNSFINQLKNTVKYINYFVQYFDEDNELFTGYLLLLFSIKNSDIELPMDNFMYMLLSIIGADSMIKKYVEMIEHNMRNIKLKPPKENADESIQITEDHYKTFMTLAVIHKCIIPIVSCYFDLRKKEVMIDEIPISEKEFYFLCFTAFIPIVDREYDVDLYSKLYQTSVSRISKTRRDALMWDRRRYFGTTRTGKQSELMKDLFVDLSQKSIFNKSAINLIHVSFDRAIKNLLIKKDKVDVSEIRVEESESDDNATQYDILQMNNARYSIEERNRANLKNKDIIKRLCKEYDIEIHQKDIDFYKKHYKLTDNDKSYTPSAKVQVNIIFLFFTKYTESYRVTGHMKPEQFLKLIIIFKEILTRSGYRYLPHLISGDIDRISSKRFNKNKLSRLIEAHPLYDSLRENYSFLEGQIKKENFIESLRDLVTTRVYVVDHRFPEETLERKFLKIQDAYENIADEIVRFLYSL